MNGISTRFIAKALDNALSDNTAGIASTRSTSGKR
jgi:predicted Ser/Thr protein kinase